MGAKSKIRVAESRPAASKYREAIVQIRKLEADMASILRAMEEKVQQLELMNQFSSLLNSTLDTAIVREKSLEATCRLLKCETASLFLVDRKTAELYWETALGETGKELQRSIRLPIDDRSIAGYVAMTGESLLIHDVENDPRYFKRASAKATAKTAQASPDSPDSKPATPAFQTKTMVCVPLRTKGQTIGVLQALNRLPTTDDAKLNQKVRSTFRAGDLRLLEALANQVAVAIENSRLYSSIKTNFYETVEALAEAIDKKDRYTGGHTKRVVYYSMCISKYLSLTAEQLERIRLGAVLHDVGKIGVEDKILKKNAPLDAEEWKVMQTHPEQGYDIMKRVEGLKDVMGGMRYHHERWDGKGYPLGLKGEEIPLIARIISVADTYDAMVSTRPYRKGLDPQIAFDEIVKNKGTQFDPTIVDAFVEAYHHEKMGKGSGGSSLPNCD